MATKAEFNDAISRALTALDACSFASERTQGLHALAKAQELVNTFPAPTTEENNRA